MSRFATLSACLSACLVAGCASSPAQSPATASGTATGGTAYRIEVAPVQHPAGETPAWWYRSGAARAAANGAMDGRAKNVIVFLGDGMSLTTVAAARILEGQRNGRPGEENLLSWEHFPHTGFSKTYNTDSQTPDSAGTMTAIASGVKSHMGAIGVSAGKYGDCRDTLDKPLLSWLRLGSNAGLSTGIVTTARLTHATPAATYAHASNRNWESDTNLSADAKAAGCTDIASQFVDAVRAGHGPTLALGGGAQQFLPESEVMPGIRGKRGDGRNLVEEWQAARPDGAFVHTTSQLRAARNAPSVLGLFDLSHMQYEHDRDKGPDGQPDIEEMTRFAIEHLSRNQDGYVLLVEGARIDHANHEGNAYRALDETIAMSRAVQAAADMTSADDTLILITADHSHTLSFVGYPKRGNPILDKVRGRTSEEGDPNQYALDAMGLTYTTLIYANGPGYVGASASQPEGPKTHPHDKTGRFKPYNGRPDLLHVDTQHPDYLQEALVPMGGETHGGDDVGIWARGPGSHAVRGTMEQNVIYHIIVQAMPKLRERLCAAGTCNADGVPVELPAPKDF